MGRQLLLACTRARDGSFLRLWSFTKWNTSACGSRFFPSQPTPTDSATMSPITLLRMEMRGQEHSCKHDKLCYVQARLTWQPNSLSASG